MSAIFLSASVPVLGRAHYHETANPFLIQYAVREFVMAVIKRRQIVWGGHPAITPMIWRICEDLGVKYSESVTLYQSMYFEDRFPEENKQFRNVIFTDAVDNDRAASLSSMREKMLSRDDLESAVFIGGMDGIEVEYEMFIKYHPAAKVLAIAAPGGASLDLAHKIHSDKPEDFFGVDFSKIYHSYLINRSN